MRQTNVRGTLSLRGFRKLRTGVIVATGVILLGLGFLAPTVSANEQDGVWIARTVAEVKADIQNINNLSHYTIKWGDTLSAISGATGLSVDSLVEINRIANRDLIFANNKLYFSEETFLKDGNTEVKRQRVSIDNSGSCQSYEVETKTDTVTGEQTTTVKQTTPVVVETPAAPESKAEASSTQSSDPTPASVTPSETSTSAQPVGEVDKSETKAESSNPSSGVRSEGHSGVSTPVTDNSPSDTGTTNQPVVSNPSSESPAPSTPKNAESGSSVDSSSTGNHSEESETPSTTPAGDSTATQSSDTSTELVTPSETSTPAQPVGEVDKAETKAESSNPSSGVRSEGHSGASTPVIETTPSNSETTNQPVVSNPSSEVATPSVPKNAESGSSVYSSSTGNHSEESETPSTTPAGDSTATQSSDTSTELVTPSETSTPAQPVGEVDKAETSNPSSGVTNEGHSGASTPVTETTPSNSETTNQAVASIPSSEASAAPAPKDDESGSSVESPSTGNHSDESGAPSTTPTGDSTATQPSDSTSSPVTPNEEAPVTSGDTNSTTQPAGEIGNSETTAEPSNTPSADATNESGNSESSSSATDNTSSNTGTAEQPVASNPSSEAPSTQPSDTSTESVTPSDTSTPAQPAGKVDKSETKAESSNPSSGVTSDGHSGASTPVTETTPSNSETTNQPVVSNPSSESPASKADTPSEEIAPKDEKLEEAKKDGKDIIEKIAASKLSEIEKVKDEAEKAKLEAKLKELKEAGLEAINNAKDHDAAVDATAEYQSKIDEIDVPGEELPAPNYNKDNLTNGRNEGTTIDNGSTAIGHGSGEAPTQPATEERSTLTASPTQPASTETTAGTSSFRNAPSVQARARRVARSTSEPDGTVNISYNFAGMPDIHGFLSDPGENNTVTIPAGTNEEQAKELVKEKIQAKIKDLATRGYHVKNDIIFEQDTTVKNYNYVVTFTKEATGTSGFRMAPAVQPRASRNRRSLEQPAPQKVKVNVFYNFDQMKDIAGFLGDINGTSLEIAEGLSNEQVKAAVKSQVDAKKEELSKRGYTFKEDYVYQANGKDYNYVVTFSKAAK